MQSIPFELDDRKCLDFPLSGLCVRMLFFLRCFVFGKTAEKSVKEKSIGENHDDDDYDMEQKANAVNENN